MEPLVTTLNFAAALLTFIYIVKLLAERGNGSSQIHFSDYGFVKRSLLNQHVSKRTC